MINTHTATTVTSFGAPAADPRPAFAHVAEVASIVIDAVRPDQLDQPTPCTDMDVRQLLGHLVMVAQRVACAGRADDPATWPTEPTHLADEELAPAFAAELPAAVAAWTDDAVLARVTDLPWGTFTGAEVLATYVNETIVHTWDLAQATGQLPTWDDGAVQVAHAAIVGQLPMADRTEYWAGIAATLPEGVPWSDPFASATDVAEDAPLIDRLIAWNGRHPNPTA